MGCELSVVVPVFNEAETLGELHRQLTKTLVSDGLTYELLFVDDGSTDGSFSVLKEMAGADPNLRVVRLARNFGQHVALAAGIERSRGEVVILMDADLENDPGDIPKFVAKIREGYALVSGWRTGRPSLGWMRSLGSTLVNRLLAFSTGVFLHDYGCGFKALTRRLAMETCQYGYLRRFLPLLLVRLAGSVAEVPLASAHRRSGRSRYDLGRLIGLMVDFLTGFSSRPFRLLGGAGVMGSALAGLLGLGYVVGRVAFGMPANDRLLAAILLLLFGSLQIAILGLLGEFVVRTYHASQQLPLYVVDEELNTPPGSRC